MSIDLALKPPPKGTIARIFSGIFRQRSKMQRCPPILSFDGLNVLISGGSAGLGEYVSRALLEAGAHVTSLSRGVSHRTDAITELKSIACDLAAPESVVSAVNQLGEQKFDIVICNSGVVLKNYEETSLGLEKTFAVNVFGHHLLYRLLIGSGMLNHEGRIVITTGDIYLEAKDLPSDPKSYKRVQAYAHSKLNNLWQVLELTKRYPNIRALAVHPGVVASGFGGGSKSGFSYWLKNRLLISEEDGAQAALIAATQNLPHGAYWHNVIGHVHLPYEDIANDRYQSSKLWDKLEKLAEPWL